MAVTTYIKPPNLLSVTTFSLLILLHPCFAFSFLSDINDGEDNIVDSLGTDQVWPQTLSQPKRIRKGARCAPHENNICNGIPVNKGTGLLQCCKKHCRNVLGDCNNCGYCGHKCRFQELCCNGVCTDVNYNTDHCGKCNVKCSSGLKCEFASCGYA